MSLFGPQTEQTKGGNAQRTFTPPEPLNSNAGSLFEDDDDDDDDDNYDNEDEATRPLLKQSGASEKSKSKEGRGKDHGSVTSKDKRTASTTKGSWLLINQIHLNAMFLTLLSAITRFYKIGWSDRVIWDEAHFGKFGAYYVNGTFYHDVHPPLAKMLVGFSEILTGFDGSFTFPSGKVYPDNVNYTFMRLFNASFGVPMAPMAYYTLLNLGCSSNAALLGGFFVCFDNALCTISRFILLDSMLLCFTSMSALSLSGVYKHRKQPFTVNWWKWIVATGVSLGLVTSSKWVGFLAVALVGLYTLYELYDLLEDTHMGATKYMMHWVSRAFALIAIPLAIYLLCFKIHFSLLYKSGSGDAVMDSLFQANLEGTNIKNQPLDVAYGSQITLKSSIGGAGLLHSHPDTYPDGSKQQQITGYTHKDQNNDWIISKVHGKTYGNTSDTVEFVKDGDIIRLLHFRTQRNLHSHAVKAPMSKRDLEVSGYGTGGTYPDSNDHWRVEFVQELIKNNPEHRLRALATRFRLHHVNQKCTLRASGKSLPQWAWRQAEIACDKRNRKDDSTIWNIEQNTNPLLPPAKASELKTSFFRDFVRLNSAMARTNNALVPDQDKLDLLTSAPYEWPIMRLGLRMCGWEDNKVKFYLTGNPVVWWMSSLAAVLGPLHILYYLVRRQRGLSDFARYSEWENHLYVTGILWGGWALHYLPFFLMGRVTYLHHYFPAVYFAAMYLSYLVEWNVRRITSSTAATNIALGVFGILAFANFMYFAPFTFGFDYPAKELSSRKWVSTWNIYDAPKNA
ncbi:Protein O-mannosyltransferase 2 [Coemansia sp. RSA 1813]|nr:Protein O-mannosyltransferase 2 [Coemansia sp. RSA 1843]KAJ2091576.1 Protein O-mannosyltransferase 2 [Coemansia sp. RSA 986]KAJ2212040.1 Protein O-mannosyltransferase 2 [Coemansia sp. RSA 487]KAJ2572224.1 Protein O-mannosyltransferase 2 [Coemansia sp. RSA 1813]